MSVQKTPTGFKVRWRDAAGIHRSKCFAKGERKLANAYDDEIKRAKRLGYLPELQASKRTVGEAAADWWVAHGSQKQPRTVQHYHYLLHKYVLPELGEVRLGELGVDAVEMWLARLETGPVAKRHALGVLSSICTFAVRARWIQGNPCSLAIKPKRPDKEPCKPLWPEQVEAVRAKLLADRRLRDATIVSVLSLAGLRPHEMWRLGQEDVRGGKLLARASKTGRFRPVDAIPPLAEDLDRWFSESPGDGPLFTNDWGQAFSKTTWDNWRNRVWKQVAPKGTTPYNLRHGFVSLGLNDPQLSRAYIAQQAGHSLEVQDRTYAHVILDGRTCDRVEAVERVRGDG